jgi:HEPN domain-containing protein
MDKQTELRQWIEIADHDFAVAQHLAENMHPAPYEIICFHCQQTIEKYLKWFLVLHDIEPPKIHDLEELEKLCETIAPQFSTVYEKCSYLTEYGVQSRYPSEMRLEKEDMDRALIYAELIREFIRAKVPDQFKNGDNEANPRGRE